jgi:arsenite/tail-anchored protein-transporting ATPase
MALPRLIFVTGKGGTGKSTVAAALAMALARRRPTTLADLDGNQSAMRLVGMNVNDAGAGSTASSTRTNTSTDTLTNSENSDAALDLIRITPQGELEAFIQRIVPLRAVSRRMLQSRTFGYVTAALPGLEAFLMLERLRQIAGHAALNDRFAVIDAPATGHALELLAVAKGIRNLAPAGTLNRLSSAVEEFLIDRNRFGVIVTVMPEELALREALETVAALRDRLGIECVAAILNGVPTALFSPAEIAKLSQLEAHARLADRRRIPGEFARHARREFERAGLAVAELPMLYEASLGAVQVETLSQRLASEMLAR